MGDPGADRVLVVDDESAIRDIIHRYLAAEGYQVAEAADDQEALDRSPRSVPTWSCWTC
jgi:CheY-like chemotaxis protein